MHLKEAKSPKKGIKVAEKFNKRQVPELNLNPDSNSKCIIF